MTQAAEGELRDEVEKEPAAAPASGSERFWRLARLVSLLLMAAALIIPWTFDGYSGFDVALWTAAISPLLVIPGMAAFLLGGALLWSNRFSPGVIARLSRANIVALCLALPIGLGAWVFILLNNDSGPYWGWPVYVVGVATALVVEIGAFKTIRANEPPAALASEWWPARLASLLLIATLFTPWTHFSLDYVAYNNQDTAVIAFLLPPLSVAVILLGGTLLWSDRFSPRVSTRLSRANIVALCLALLIGLGAVFIIIIDSDPYSSLGWEWPVYFAGVATALVVEIRTFKMMRGKEPPAAPVSGSERFWWPARLVSLLLMAAAPIMPWTFSSIGVGNHFLYFRGAYVIAAILPPLILAPGVAAFLLGGALLLLSDRFSPRVSTRLSRANIVALCLALLIGLGAVFIIIVDSDPYSRLNWGWSVYLVGVATALVVEINATRKTGLLTLALFALLAVCFGGLVRLITSLRTAEGDWRRFDASNSPVGEIQVMSVDDQGRAWFFSDGELHVYDVAADAWSTHSLPAGPIDQTPPAVAAHGDQVLISYHGGLHYFDGANWERPLEGQFNLLGFLPDGTAWADPGGSFTAEGFWRYDGNAWNRDEAVRACAGAGGFDTIRSDAEGRFWASYGNSIQDVDPSVLLIEGGECRQIFVSESDSVLIAPTSQGSVWILVEDTGIVELDAQGEIIRELEHAPELMIGLTQAAVGPDGSLWLGADYGLLRYTPDGEWVNYALPGDVYYFGPKVVLFDQAGGMWVEGFGWVAYLPAEG